MTPNQPELGTCDNMGIDVGPHIKTSECENWKPLAPAKPESARLSTQELWEVWNKLHLPSNSTQMTAFADFVSREREQEVARACAKVMCEWCAKGKPFLNATQHGLSSGWAHPVCEAVPIRKLYPEAFAKEGM